ncbi:hemicentin-1-like [Etheostoma cragini]|uniref:hemicentin-1-like n=1 Tax=Etheostoma cragini TaxID=417921 RepID=UPI00155EA23B|nr:hemicentin-1-like [Etheostoma cragini]
MSESTSFVRLFVGILLSATGVHASCPIELSPPSVVVRYGHSVSVNCSTSESRFEGIGWEARQGGIGLKKATYLVWTVENLTDWTVSPSCYINPLQNSQFQQCVKKPGVVLYTFPDTISIYPGDAQGHVMTEGEKYNFMCDINNIAPVQNLTVRWYKGGEMVYADTFDNPKKEPVNQSSVFSFTPSRQDNGVTFRCEAHLDLWPKGPQLNASSQECTITVFFGPDVQCSSLPDKLELLEGETLERGCPVTGRPTPGVTWLKDGQPTNQTVPLSRKDTGQYTVEAEGSGFVKKKLWVLVLYGPEVICPNNYIALEGAPHNLTCIVEGYPEPKTIWHKDGEEVVLPEYLTRSDSGQYLITATSDLSSVNLTVEINVEYPPSQIVELEDSEVDVGSTVWLKCSSVGNPRPKYFWNYYRTANVIEENEDGVSRLHIHNATVYNMGSYTCHAWNDRGNVSKTARVTVKGASQECPVEITPDRMVIQYQSRGQKATCKATSANSRHVKEIYWKGFQNKSTSWSVDTYNDWDSRPVCTATFNAIGTCHKHLNFTLYKTPDSVSVRPVDNLNSVVVEEREFQLQCDITNVAPAGNLIVLWYRGNETFEPLTKGSMQVTGCLSEKDTNCDISVVRSPLNVSSTISLTLDRNYNGAEFRCDAQLDLGPTGPRPPPNMMSSPLNISIYYKPSINTTKLPKTIPVFRGYPEELVCEADGHPPPKIQWLYSSDLVPHVSGNTLTVYEAGVYNCSATNEVDSISHEVKVILKEDYLPLIAGFVAVTVVAISIFFLFIYSIYYKNTRMRRYSLKNPKLDTHSGNVAHNGWDMQFPMTKLSCYGKPVRSSCPVEISMSPPEVVVRFGDPFSVICSSPSNRTQSMGWESPYGTGIGLKDRASSVSLKIDSMKIWELKPLCFINLNVNHQQCLQTLSVTVYKMPDSVSMSQPSQTGPMVEGKKYRMQCDIVNVAPVGNLSVYWHKGNEIIYTEAFNKTSPSPANAASVFNLTAQRSDNGTQIWCEAKLEFSPSVPNLTAIRSKSHELVVLYSPTFTEPENETMHLEAGSKIILNCTATGNPMPVYSWHFPQPIQQTNINENEPILAPSFELPGNYTCTASNTQGTRTKTFTVIEVTMSGEGCSLILKPSRVVVGFGEPVSVSCEATRPVRVLGWESVISAVHTQQDLSVRWKVDSLIDWIEEPICYGVFFTAPRQCEEKLNLVLYKTPDSVSIRPANHTGPMVEGKEYQLLCDVQNIAPVQYLTLRWYKGQTEVYNHSFSDLTSSSPVQVSSILMVTPTKAEDGAQYRCVAELELGPEGPQPPPTVTSEPLNVSVYFPPMFLSPEPEVLNLIVGAAITLNCTATGNPAPVYSWQSSNPMQERMEDEAVLTSPSLLPGTYTCTASNTLEKKSKLFIVKAKTKGV